MITLINKIFPAKTDLSHKGILIAGLSAFIAIAFVTMISRQFLSGLSVPLLVASMGATAVILFAVPTSPMAKVWAVLGGHVISACIGVICYQHIPDLVWAAAVAVFLSITLMLYLRCLHPPGGATAMAAIIGGQDVHSIGFQFVLAPVAFNVVAILLTALIFQWLISLQYNKKVVENEGWWEATTQVHPLHTSYLNDDDLHIAMQTLDQYVDVNTEELSQIFNLAVAHAQTRHLEDALCRDVMQPVVTVEFATELEEVWQLLKLHGLHGVPVVNRVNHLIGIVTIADFARHAEAMPGNTEQERLKRLVSRTDGLHSDKPEVAGQIMTNTVHTLGPDDRITAVVTLFRERRFHHVPIVDENNKLLGMISSKDLNAMRA